MEFVRLGLGESLHDYVQTWELQREIHSEVVAGTRDDTVLLLEHSDVLTAGRRTNRADRPTDGTPVVDVDRGGKITWHGPGQLVVYPILRLAEPIDVLAYVHALEEAVMRLAAEYGVATRRVDGRSGVWVPGAPDRKLASIGVRVAKNVTMHGIAVNANPDLGSFSGFVPCGIPDVGVTSLSAETDSQVLPAMIADSLTGHLTAALSSLLAAAAEPRQPGRQQDHVDISVPQAIPVATSA